MENKSKRGSLTCCYWNSTMELTMKAQWNKKRVKGSYNLPIDQHVMDCLVIQWYHCPSICFSNRREIFAEKMLAGQSRADGLRQHIKGLCGSVVSINGLSKSWLPSSFSAHSYSIMMMLPDAEVRRSTKWNWFQTETSLLLTVSKMCCFSCMSESQRPRFVLGIASCSWPSFGIFFLSSTIFKVVCTSNEQQGLFILKLRLYKFGTLVNIGKNNFFKKSLKYDLKICLT